MIPAPFLLYLGHSDDEVGIKTSRGLAIFRPQDCVGEWRHDGSPLTLGLPRMNAAEARAAGAQTLVLGIANAGGRLGEALIEDALAAIATGMNVVSGLHQRLRDEPRLVRAAAETGVTLFDVRDPPAHLPVGTGKRRAGNRLLTVGTDCSVGKMYATLLLQQALRARGVTADFRATGQTGILIAGEGVPLDAVVADFISGAVEWLSPAAAADHWDLVEGQGSLFHPSFAGVSLGLLHGAQPDAFVVCHEPTRTKMRGVQHALPSIEDVIDLTIRCGSLTNPAIRCVGIAINTAALDDAAATALLAETSARLSLPAVDPIRTGVAPIVAEIGRVFGKAG